MSMDALACAHAFSIHVEVEYVLVGYTATVYWRVRGGRGVSMGKVSQFRPLDVFGPLSSSESSS